MGLGVGKGTCLPASSPAHTRARRRHTLVTRISAFFGTPIKQALVRQKMQIDKAQHVQFQAFN